jgi:VWFA-related protein
VSYHQGKQYRAPGALAAMPRHPILLAAVSLALALGLAAQGTQQQTGPVIIPKKKVEPAKPTAPPPPPPKPEKPQFSFSVNVPEVEIPVSVETKSGMFVPGLGAAQFALYEDGVRQKIDKVAVTTDAPMTVVMLVEFRNGIIPVIYNALQASYAFTDQLQPQDWVALMTFDLKPTVVVDFTHDKNSVYAGLRSLQVANYSEADLFDALSDTIDRLDGVKGRKTLVLIASGLNTFSHMNFDQLKKKISQTQNITIFSVNMSWALEEYLDEMGMTGAAQMPLLQGANEMRYFADATGGRYYQPRFQGGFPDVFKDISADVRSQYMLSYVPTNKKLDGTERKIKVELVAPDGKPLQLVDPKGKKLKYTLDYRDSYTARHVVE